MKRTTKRTDRVWAYVVLDSDGETHIGISAGVSRPELIEDIQGNYPDCLHADIHAVDGLKAEMCGGEWTGRVGRRFT